MLIASTWSAVLIGVCLFSIAALPAMGWALAPFLREIFHTGSVGQKQAVGGLVLLAAVEAGASVWLAVAP